MIAKIRKLEYRLINGLFEKLDKKFIRRSLNIKNIPSAKFRRGGKASLIEWSHVIGIFQALIGLNLPKKGSEKTLILDIGCGTGLLALASEPHLIDNGQYIGIDVMEKDIAFCRKHYHKPYFKFIHHDLFNPTYSEHQRKEKTKWDIEQNSADLVTALSVWTHLNEEDAIFYFKEIDRVLKPGGKAIITFFLLDSDYYQRSYPLRKDQASRYHNTKQTKWIFDVNAYGSGNWFTTKWAKHAEDAIAITSEGLDKMLSGLNMDLITLYPGNWREASGMYFQDILVFQKKE